MNAPNTTSGPEVNWVSTPKSEYKLLKQYPEDSISTYQLLINGLEQDAKHIIRFNPKGSDLAAKYGETELITQQKMLYEVITNSAVLRAGAEVAEEMGAVPFHEFTGPWFVKADDNVLYNERQTRVHALYAFEQKHEVTGPDDTIQLGFSLHNSIDGFLGFGGSMFTFRHACRNMFFMGFRGKGMKFDDRNVLSYFYKRHTQELDKETIKKLLTTVNERGLAMVDALRKLPKLKITDLKTENVESLISILPEEIIQNFTWVKKEEKKTVVTKPETDLYKVWNDMTAYLTHDSENLALESMMKKQKTVEEVLVAPLIKRNA
jgi:hypothetical protein